jgi:hypothetical protein
MSSHGAKLEPDHGPGTCGRGGCLCRCHPSDPSNLPVRKSNVIPTLSRRRLFGATLGGASAVMLSGVGAEFAIPRAASAQSTLTPDDALRSLMDGNRRFVERHLTSFQDAACVSTSGRFRDHGGFEHC